MGGSVDKLINARIHSNYYEKSQNCRGVLSLKVLPYMNYETEVKGRELNVKGRDGEIFTLGWGMEKRRK